MNNKFKSLALGISALTLLAACGGSTGEKKADAPTETKKVSAPAKDRLVVAQGADAKTLDPHATNDQPSSRVSAQIYDRLVEQDEKMQPQPGLAEKWEQPDPRTTVFHLRKGVKFHNGEELKASDVKFTLDRMMASPTVAHIAGSLEKVEVVDDYTVKLITKQPFGPLLNHLAHTAASILNEKAVKEGGDAYGQKPVGTGPYMINTWQAGDSITLKANPDYYKGASPIPTVVFRNIPEGTNRTIGLETQEIDIAYDIEPMDKKRVADDQDLTLIEEPSLSMAYLGFNTNKKPFDDKRVRQAIAYGIDVQPIIDTVYQGAGTPANSPIGPLVFGYSKDAKGYPHDMAKAKELMKESGHENGFDFKIWTNDSPARRDIATIVQDQLKPLGVNVAIETLEWGAYLDGTARGDHDMFILGWVSVTGDADYGLYALFHSSAKGGAGNRSFYSNPEVDALLDQARGSTDNNERVGLYDKAQKMIQEDLPIITLAYTTQNVGVQKNVMNFKMNPAGHHKVYGVSFEGGESGN
ncbi:MAG: glutathione ABC transporter substrate-binding protein [Fusobacteriaceae bacterium]